MPPVAHTLPSATSVYLGTRAGSTAAAAEQSARISFPAVDAVGRRACLVAAEGNRRKARPEGEVRSTRLEEERRSRRRHGAGRGALVTAGRERNRSVAVGCGSSAGWETVSVFPPQGIETQVQ